MPITNVRPVKFKTTINKAGKTVDWVLYGNAESLQSSLTWARVKDLMPPEDFDDDRDKQGVKLTHMKAVWSQLEPRYNAWKSGSQMPETGTPLTAWPGLNEAEIEAFNRAGIRSVEEVAEMGDGLISKVQLPGVREHRAQARKFLEMADKAHALDRIAELEARLAELAAAQEAPKRGPGRPKKAEAQAEDEAA